MRPEEKKVLSDQEARDQVKSLLDTNIILEASAGSGKTSAMAARFLALLESGRCEISEIVAITFTKKAANELKERIRKELNRTGNPMARELHQSFIGTIHAFSSKLLRERPVEAGVDPQFQELEEGEDDRIRDAVWDEYVMNADQQRNEVLSRFDLFSLKYDALKEFLQTVCDNPDLEFSLPYEREMDLQRFYQLIDSTWEALRPLILRAASFVPKEIVNGKRDALQATLAICLPKIRRKRPLSDVEKLRVLKWFHSKSRIAVTQKNWGEDKETKAQAKEIGQEFLEFKEQYIAPLFQLRAEYGYNHVAVPFVKEAQAIYENRKKELGVLNFQDLLIKATDLLREHPEVRRYFQSKYKALLVDEFQDTDPIQAKMLMYLTSRELSEKRWDRITPIPGSLFVVGDPKQSIYGFRRADIDIYYKFLSRVLETGGQKLLLTTNFRSVKELGSWFNGKFNQIFRTEGKQAMYSDADTIRESLSGTFSGVGSYKIDASNASAIAAVEPAGIARLIQYIVTHQSLTEGTDVLTQRPVQYRDIMVLFLKKNVLTRYGKELSELGIPVKTTGADVVTRTPQFQALADIIRMLAYPEENALLYKVLQGPAFGFTDQELFRFYELGGHFNIYADLDRVLLLLQPEHDDYRLLVRIRDAYRLLSTFAFYMRKMVPAAATERIITDLGMTARMLESRKSVTEIGSFVSLIEKIRLNKLTNVWDLNQFVEEIQVMVGSGYEEEIDLEEDQFNAVQMMNLHKAKGLEAPIVILASPCGGKIKEPKFYVARSVEELKPENLEAEMTQGEMAQGEALTAVAGDPDEERAWGITRIKLSTNFWSKEYIQPAAWDRIQEAAMGKQEAEQVRLLYVAATRAHNALIISDSASEENYWSGLLDGKEKEIDREIAEAGFQFTPPSRLDESDESEAALELTLEKILQRTDAAFSHFESTYEMFTPSEKVKKGSAVEPLEGMELDPDLILLNSMEVYIEGDREVFRTLRTQLGTAIHKILEGVIRGDRNLDQLISFVAKQIDKKEVSEQLLRDVADTFVTSSLYRRVRAAKEVYTEVPITVRVPAGSSFAGNQFDKDCYINGSIDLVLREGDGWTVVDYKTCARTEVKSELVKRYQPQLDAYKEAWELATGEQVAKTEIFFIEKS